MKSFGTAIETFRSSNWRSHWSMFPVKERYRIQVHQIIDHLDTHFGKFHIITIHIFINTVNTNYITIGDKSRFRIGTQPEIIIFYHHQLVTYRKFRFQKRIRSLIFYCINWPFCSNEQSRLLVNTILFQSIVEIPKTHCLQ